MRKATPFTFYFLYFAATAALIPFIVLYYQQLGFSGGQIGLLAGMSPLIVLVGAPFWTGVADSTRRHRLVMSLALVVAIAGALVFPLASTFGQVVLLIVVYSFFAAPIGPLSDSATLTMLAGEKDMYGRVRMGGTIGFGLAALIAGLLVQNYGLRLAFWSYALLMFLALLVSQRFVYGRAAAGDSVRGRARDLLTNRRWILFLAMAFACGVGFAAINTYLFPYMRELNASESTMGLALTIATLSELPVLFYANRLLGRFGSFGLLVVGMAVTGIRLLLYAAVSLPAGILVFQVLNGLTFPAVWVAGVAFADENAPTGLSATAQGLFSAMVFGIGAAAGGLIGGLLLENVGGRVMYLVFGLFVLLSLAILAPAERRLTRLPQPPHAGDTQHRAR
jgi:MFS transporter, PPP family, 3-phenylpropionic acid transporter